MEIKGVFEMKYVLNTVYNGTQKVLEKGTQNGKIVYVATEIESGSRGIVDRNWVLSNIKNIKNAGLTKDGKIIYKKTQEEKIAKEQLEIIKKWYKAVFDGFDICYVTSDKELVLVGYLEDGIPMVEHLGHINPFDLAAVSHALYKVYDNFDPDYEAKLLCGMEDLDTPCHELSNEESDEDYSSLIWRYESLENYKDELNDLSFGLMEKASKLGYKKEYLPCVCSIYNISWLSDVIQIKR